MKREVCLLVILLLSLLIGSVSAAPSASVSSPWKYSFSVNGILYETGSLQESSSPYFWLNSGAKLILSSGRGMTIQRDLSINDYWRKLYSKENPLDTDNGYYPQNIFRLVTRSKWQNFGQSVYFKIINDQLSMSSNRAEHNGLLLMSRYQQEGDTLYYTGLRVDGYAVIKKKLNGAYTTLAFDKVFPGIYNRDSNPNLLTKNIWLGLKSEISNNPDGSVTIKLYMDTNWNNRWVLIAEATDSSNPIRLEGYAGIRTDFMDVIFDNYEFKSF